ncbi:MAG: VTT domain-containing protein [Pseudolabrys sp.]
MAREHDSGQGNGEESALAGAAVHKLWRAGAVVAAVLVVVAVLLAFGWRDQVSLESLIRHRAMLVALVAAHPFTALASFVVIYALAAGMALPGVVFLTIGGGAVFGGLIGGLAAMVGATAGATAVFAIGKTLLRRPAMRRLGPQARRFAAGFRSGAFNYLLFIRLVPIFPFTLGNLLPALSGMRLMPFVAATFFGIAPMTLAIAFFGAGLDSALGAELESYRACVAAGGKACALAFSIWMAVTPQLLGGLLALGLAALLPVAIRRYRKRRGYTVR